MQSSQTKRNNQRKAEIPVSLFSPLTRIARRQKSKKLGLRNKRQASETDISRAIIYIYLFIHFKLVFMQITKHKKKKEKEQVVCNEYSPVIRTDPIQRDGVFTT